MKKYFIPIFAVVSALTFVAWSAIAASTTEATTLEKEKLHARMVSKQAEIYKRVGMSAPMELPEVGESDFVTTAMEEGRIIEATLEEVEAALIAAGATPSRQDDIAAMRMAHRGSYRYFLDGIVTAKAPTAR